MNNNTTYGQVGTDVYAYLAQVQAAYSRYLQVRTQLTLFDNSLKTANDAFERAPNMQNLTTVQNAWLQKYNLMRQIPSIVDSIVANLVAATKSALSSMQICLTSNNRMGVMLNDNAIASICTYVEQKPNQMSLLADYKYQCFSTGISMQLSDIEMRTRMNGILTPNFNRLKIIIRGY